MASTKEHISIRIPIDLLEKLRKEALEVDRSVSWLIVKKLGDCRKVGEKQLFTPAQRSSHDGVSDRPEVILPRTGGKYGLGPLLRRGEAEILPPQPWTCKCGSQLKRLKGSTPVCAACGRNA